MKANRINAPFHDCEYSMLKRLSWCWDADDFIEDVQDGFCKIMYKELQEYYEGLHDRHIYVIPVNCDGKLLRMYTRNLRHAYERCYIPRQMVSELLEVCVCLPNGYKDMPEILDSHSLSVMHPDLRAVVDKYICTLNVGQIVISTEILDKRGASWEECFDEPFRDVLVAINI